MAADSNIPAGPKKRRKRRLNRERLRKRIKQVVVQRFMVRFHMMLILAALVGAGVVASKLLRMAGMTEMGMRWPIVVLIAYGLFFVCVKLWLRYVRSHLTGDEFDTSAQEEPKAAEPPEEVAEPIAVAAHPHMAQDVAYAVSDLAPRRGRDSSRAHDDDSSWNLFDLFDSDSDSGGEALVIIALIVLVLAVLVAAVVFIFQAPAVLAEAAAEVILAGVVGRRLRREHEADWEGHVFQRTWIAVAILMVAVFLAGSVIDAKCPEADDAPTALRTCT